MSDRISVRDTDSGASQQGTEKWRFETDDTILSSPTIIDGTVYIGSMNGKVYALSADDGVEQWQFQTGSRVYSSPSVVDGTVYFGSWDSKVYAVDAESGTEQWHYDTGSRVQCSTTVAGDTVFVGNYDGIIFALDATNGTVRWEFEAGNLVRSSPTVIDGTVFVGSSDEHMYALDAKTGAKRWQFETISRAISSPTVVDELAVFGGRAGTVYAVDANTGEEEWRTDVWVESAPTILDDTVFVGSVDYHAYALDASDGSIQWSFNAGRGNSVESSPTVVGNTVFVGSDGQKIHALNSKNGDERWYFETDERVYSSPTVVDGTLFVGTGGGNVYALNTGISNSSEGSRVRLGTLGHHEAWADRQAEEQSTETQTETTRPSTPESPKSTAEQETVAPTSYSYYPSVTIEGQEYHVLRDLDLPNEPGEWAVVQGNLDDDEFVLAPVDTAAHAFTMNAWRQRPHRDYQTMIEDAENKIIQWENGRIINELAQLGVDFGVVIALINTGNAELAVGTIIETIEDATSWGYETVQNPYQEVYSRIQGIVTTQQRTDRLAAEIEDMSDFGQEFAEVTSTAMTAHAAVTGGASNYTATVLGAMTSSGSVASALGSGVSKTSLLYAVADVLIATSTQVATNGYETLGQISGVAIGMHKARIPLLRRLSQLQRQAEQGQLQLYGSNSIYAFYSAEAAHDMVNAVGYAGMYNLASDLSGSWAGPLYDVMNNVEKIASEADEAKESYRQSAASVHDIAGERFTRANEAFSDSVNLSRMGSKGRQAIIPGMELVEQ